MYSMEEYRSPDRLYEIHSLAAREFGRARIEHDLTRIARGARTRLWPAVERLARVVGGRLGLPTRLRIGRTAW